MSFNSSPARATPPPPPPPSHSNSNSNVNNLSAQTSPSLQQTSSFQSTRGHTHSHSHLSGVSNSSSNTTTTGNTSSSAKPHISNSDQQARYRTSVEYTNSNSNNGNGSSSARNWSSASIRPTARPASEMLQGSVSVGAGHGSHSSGGNGGGGGHSNNTSNFASPETEAIDRWFEDLQHYEATLEEMAAASLDANFKEELSAIEQWFRVLSEAERTAALYSLLQSSTQVQMRFFVTVLQQMARADPMTALLSPSNPGQLSMEDQMDAKLASMGLKSPASPAIRQFARQSLGAPSSSLNTDSYLSPHSATLQSSNDEINSANSNSAAALASQRSKLKANARISAPANILLGASGFGAMTNEGMKSPLWNEKERVVERRSGSPSPNRPKSTGSSLEAAQPNGSHAGLHLSQSTGPPSSASFLRSPLPTQTDFEQGQLSPAMGGSWASMVNTPLVPMFGSSTIEQGTFGGITSPGLEGASNRLGTWAANGGGGGGNDSGIVLDDVRKFRRSARVSGVGGVSGGALGGMYDENQGSHSHSQQQQLQQQQQQRQSQLNQHSLQSMQQNAINLGLAGLTSQQQVQLQGQNRSGATSPGGLLSAQHAAVAAQQNWRNGLGSPNSFGTMESDQFSNQLSAFVGGLNPLQLQQQQQQQSNNLSVNGGGSPSGNLSANAQLANLIALQSQMMQQQQQQYQQLNLAAAAGIALTPAQMMSLHQQQQQQARMGMGMGIGLPMGMMSGYPMGLGGMNTMNSPGGRSPRTSNRSPGGANLKTPTLPSATGSGSNPDEPIDVTLLGDVASWLRSLRLHKYTSNFEGDNWKEMIMLDDKGLEGKGVSALGARRKLLKVFETVRSKMGMALPGDAVNTTGVTATGSRASSPTNSAHEDA